MRRTLLVSVIAVCLSAGCGSVCNHVHFNNPSSERVYGGVRLDAETARECGGSLVRGEVKTPKELAAATFFGTMCLVDLPFSLVADTLWLRNDMRVTREKEALAANPELASMPHTPEK